MDERALRYLEATLDAAEQQFVALLARGLVGEPPMLRILGDLRRVLAALAEVDGRRDMTFPTVERLRGVRARAVWLYRRLVQEQVFARKAALEQKLKSLISPEAYQVYLSLQECELEEDADRAASDEELALRLMG
jgi:hypothetical protein